MRLQKSTSDGYFKLTVESAAMDDDDEVPTESIELLIHELELLAAALTSFLVAEKDPHTEDKSQLN